MVGDVNKLNWLKCREIAERFGHMESRLIRSGCDLAAQTGFHEVEIYPYWEHPTYLRAESEGLPYKVDYPESAVRRLTVYASGLQSATLSPQTSGDVEWSFHTQHPGLWPYEEQVPIYVNQPLNPERWINLLRKLADAQMIELDYFLNPSFLAPVIMFGQHRSFCLGQFPASICTSVETMLSQDGISVYCQSPSPAATSLVLFSAGDDTFIAKDFEIDLPIFQHHPSWVTLT